MDFYSAMLCAEGTLWQENQSLAVVCSLYCSSLWYILAPSGWDGEGGDRYPKMSACVPVRTSSISSPLSR
jgi:hypothetical protein